MLVRLLIFVMALNAFQIVTLGQGTLLFQTRVQNASGEFIVDAPLLCESTYRVDGGLNAQLLAGALVGGSLSPVFPITTIGTGANAGYVNPVVVTIPVVAPGDQARIEMWVFDGPTLETSDRKMLVGSLIVTLGEGLSNPGVLQSLILTPIPICIPEPEVPVVIGIGLSIFSICRRNRQKGSIKVES